MWIQIPKEKTETKLKVQLFERIIYKIKKEEQHNENKSDGNIEFMCIIFIQSRFSKIF